MSGGMLVLLELLLVVGVLGFAVREVLAVRRDRAAARRSRDERDERNETRD